MLGSSIAVLTSHRQTRRQVSRALGSGGITVEFLDSKDSVTAFLATHHPDLMILDCDNSDGAAVEQTLALLNAAHTPPPVVLLSLGADKGPLLTLIQRHDIGNLVAKHGAIRAVYPVLDERELLVTCEKVIRRNIFGIDKYVGSWGVVLHRDQVTSIADKVPCLTKFERYLNELDAPASVIPGIVTVAEELILNAVVHAPRLPDGSPKYETLGPTADLKLEPSEYVNVVYGCDGQRLMLSVTDNFGGLDKKTLYNYLNRGFDMLPVTAETKASGAGLGLSLSFRSIHQLIFNIQDKVRTEVIAGWYLRVTTASEFRQVGKSLNLFWLPSDAHAVDLPAPMGGVVAMSGRIDETTDFVPATAATVLDLRAVTAITSRGLLRWLRFVGGRAQKGLEIRGVPESLVRLAVEVAGVLQGVIVRTTLAPFECVSCGHEQVSERAPENLFRPSEEACPECGKTLQFAGVVEQYQAFLRALSTHG